MIRTSYLEALAQALAKEEITPELAEKIGIELGVDWESVEFTPDDLAAGMKIEMEHGTVSPDTDVSGDDQLITAKIALAHLNEFSEYYPYLADMEDELKALEGA